MQTAQKQNTVYLKLLQKFSRSIKVGNRRSPTGATGAVSLGEKGENLAKQQHVAQNPTRDPTSLLCSPLRFGSETKMGLGQISGPMALYMTPFLCSC